jgi:hypothetical protein
VLLVLVLTGSVVGGIYLLLRHEPNFYVMAEALPSAERQSQSREFTKKATRLVNDQLNCGVPWNVDLSQDEINSWLAEDFVTSSTDQYLPAGITEPRILFQPGRILLAFRYGDEDFSTVVSVQAKVWLPKRERSALAVEIESLRAGAIPLSWKLLQEHLTEGARKSNVDIQWYRNDGNPVAILRFQADKREPDFQFEQLRIDQGRIHIQGKSLDPEMRTVSALSLGRAAPAE